MTCRNCDTGKTGKHYWILSYGFRTGRELTGALLQAYSPGVADACDACVSRIPAADRRATEGRLGAKSGRIVHLERCTVTYVGGHRARNATEQIGQTVFLSAATMHRFLPRLLAYLLRGDRVRMERARKEVARLARRT